MKMSILNSNKIIKGISPIREKPTFGSDPHFRFDKTKPMGEHNFPLSTWTLFHIYGYRKDPITGIKRPYWLTKRLPTGRTLNPRMVGLDGFFDIKTTQVI